MRHLFILFALVGLTACSSMKSQLGEEETILTRHWVYDLEEQDADDKVRTYRPAEDSTLADVLGPGSHYRFNPRGHCSYLAAPFGVDRWYACRWSWKKYEDKNELTILRGFDNRDLRDRRITYEIVELSDDVLRLRFVSNVSRSSYLGPLRRGYCPHCF